MAFSRLINRSLRDAGEHRTPAYTVPARALGQASKFRLEFDLHPDDLADPDLVIDYAIEVSSDGVEWFQVTRGDGWRGGDLRDRFGNLVPPRLGSFQPDNRVIAQARVWWRQSKAARIGISHEEVLIQVG